MRSAGIIFLSAPREGWVTVVTVSPAEPRDVAAIAELCAEKDAFYGAATVGPTEGRIAEALFGETSGGVALLAWDGSSLAGMAGYSFLWPAIGVTCSLYLKELYVMSAYRRSGVGRLLMSELFGIAGRMGCSRVEWTTDLVNSAAQRFYAGLGASVVTSKLFYRVEVSG